MYQVNHTLSAAQNLVNLLNTVYTNPAGGKLSLGDFTHGNPGSITPTVGNNQSNTELTITGNSDANFYGSVNVQYKRFTLLENRPSAGTEVPYVEGDTHQDIHAKILLLHRIVASEVTFQDPVDFPAPGQSRDYVLTAIPNSTLYEAGSLTIQAVNAA